MPTNKQRVVDEMNRAAKTRDKYMRQSWYYHRELRNSVAFHIPPNMSVLEIGCGTGDLLAALKPRRGVGVDISINMLRQAREKHRHLSFVCGDVESLPISGPFDYIVISDTLGYLEDLQHAFQRIREICTPHTRVIITYHSFLWQPVLRLAEALRLKMPQTRLNWLNDSDVVSLLDLESLEVVKRERRFLCPQFVPILSWILNKWVAPLPIFNKLCLVGTVVARSAQATVGAARDMPTVSIVVPARNEMGTILECAQRIPSMGPMTEVIFVEGHSKDGTLDAIRKTCSEYARERMAFRWSAQPGSGKGDAVRHGFGLATGDILMILDADLSVAPEDLEKFYRAIASGHGEFINGSRLVYPVEKEAMRVANLVGNKFFSIMFSWVLGQRIKDTLCGTKVISRKNWESISRNRSFFGDFDPFGDFDLIFGAAKLDLRMVEVPVRYHARTYGWTNISRFRHGWLLLKMVFFAMTKLKFR